MSNLKLFLIERNCFYDEMCAVVVVAESKEDAIKVSEEEFWKSHEWEKAEGTQWYEDDDRTELIVTEIDMTKKQAILWDFQAG